jgi:hypothetical protein
MCCVYVTFAFFAKISFFFFFLLFLLFSSFFFSNVTLTMRDRKGVDEPVDSDNRGHDIATTPADRTEFAGQDDDEIPAWVIAASKAIRREVTPPEHLFFEIKGNVKIETVGRRQSSARYTISTTRQGSKGQHSKPFSHMLIYDGMQSHCNNKH